MDWKKVYQNRLKKLADHLMTGKLGHKKFDFVVFNTSYGNGDIANKCGTNGCAIGECPIIFKSWKFDDEGDPCFKGFSSAMRSAKEFFDINFPESEHLFLPRRQHADIYGGKFLEATATRKQVARNIYAFIKIKAGK